MEMGPVGGFMKNSKSGKYWLVMLKRNSKTITCEILKVAEKIKSNEYVRKLYKNLFT